MGNFTGFYTLAAALALGLLIGLERGWKERAQAEGRRVAGIRTYALIGLLGGVWGLLAQELGQMILAVAFAALALVLLGAHVIDQRRDADVGITGVVAGLLTFAFGALATLGQVKLAAAGAVVTTIILGVKPVLHAWVSRLEQHELNATLKLLLISVVVLPLLPDRGYGPWQALNPYMIWWMVVLVAGISFVGYFAMKIAGGRRGVMATALFAGLASSTAATLNFSRMARDNPGLERLFAAGVLAACATMFPRTLIVSAIFSTPLAALLLGPIVAMTLSCYLAAWLFWRNSGSQPESDRVRVRNPFELKPALGFAALLALILVLSRALSSHFGATGIYLLAAASGIADVDAITLSIASMTGPGVAIPAAALAILVAACVNSLVKAGLALGIGGTPLGLRVGPSILAVIAVGLGVWWLTVPPQL